MPNQEETAKNIQRKSNIWNIIKFFLFSFIGAFMFFIPIKIGDTSSIPLDHMVTFVENTFPNLVPYYLLAIIVFGAIYPFVNKSWNKDKVNIGLSLFKIVGVIVALMIIFDFGPEIVLNPDMGPYLFDKLVTSVGILVPIGAVFLAFLTGYGLLEFVGVLLHPFMKPVFKTPGRSTIDAVASFVGSYSIGLLITNKVFKEGKYNVKEATIIATGFSTVSATFMIVIAKNLGLMDMWNTYFWTTLIITFIVTAITVRIWPLSHISEEYYDGNGDPEEKVEGNRLKIAWQSGMEKAEESYSFFKSIVVNLRDGLIMTGAILPTILSVGLLGLILAHYTPTFDVLGYVFYPFTWIVQLPEPLLAAKAASIEIAEMFLPSLLVTDALLVTKFVIAILSVSAIIFFSALIPSILSTEIPVSIPKLIVIWVERTILTILIAAPVVYLIL